MHPRDTWVRFSGTIIKFSILFTVVQLYPAHATESKKEHTVKLYHFLLRVKKLHNKVSIKIANSAINLSQIHYIPVLLKKLQKNTYKQKNLKAGEHFLLLINFEMLVVIKIQEQSRKNVG